MIKQALTKKKNPAVTSDQWHVVHAEWSGESKKEPSFARRVVSEHGDRAAAITAANKLAAKVNRDVGKRPVAQHDQIFVRPPRYKSLKVAPRRVLQRPS
jgi:hypothetical protein